jgi:hypothetical protein
VSTTWGATCVPVRMLTAAKNAEDGEEKAIRLDGDEL